MNKKIEDLANVVMTPDEKKKALEVAPSLNEVFAIPVQISGVAEVIRADGTVKYDEEENDS